MFQLPNSGVGAQSSHRQYRNKWAWLCSSNTLFEFHVIFTCHRILFFDSPTPQSLKMGGKALWTRAIQNRLDLAPTSSIVICTPLISRLSESLVICRKVLVIILPLVVEKQRYIRQSFILFIYFFWSRISWSSSRLRLRCKKKNDQFGNCNYSLFIGYRLGTEEW